MALKKSEMDLFHIYYKQCEVMKLSDSVYPGWQNFEGLAHGGGDDSSHSYWAPKWVKFPFFSISYLVFTSPIVCHI